MNTTITEISNIFNLMVQADSRLKFYHFGWRSDINKNIDNNFDKGVQTGRLFPALHFDVPDFFQPSEELNYLGFKQDIAVNLYFDDLQNYNNSGEIKTDNLIEQWADLKQIAEDFISNLSEVLQYYKAGFIRTVPRFEPKSNLFNDRLITFEVSFTIAHFSECTEEIHKIDLLSLPGAGCFPYEDLENYKKGVICCYVGSEFSTPLDGVNSYIITKENLAVYELEATQKFTFDFYIKPDILQEGDIVNKFAAYSPTAAKGYFVRLTAAGEIRVLMTNDTNRIDLKTPAVIVSAVWQHITITNDNTATAAGVKIYVDGILQLNTVISDNLIGSINNNLEVLKIGANTTNGRYFSGLIDEVKIYNIELTQLQAECTTNLKDNNLIFFCKMGEGSIWGFINRHYPDETGLSTSYSSQNMGILDISTDTVN